MRTKRKLHAGLWALEFFRDGPDGPCTMQWSWSKHKKQPSVMLLETCRIGSQLDLMCFAASTWAKIKDQASKNISKSLSNWRKSINDADSGSFFLFGTKDTNRLLPRILARWCPGPDPGFWSGGALSPKFAQNRGFPLAIAWKLHDFEQILGGKRGSPGPQGPLDPPVVPTWIQMSDPEFRGCKSKTVFGTVLLQHAWLWTHWTV